MNKGVIRRSLMVLATPDGVAKRRTGSRNNWVKCNPSPSWLCAGGCCRCHWLGGGCCRCHWHLPLSLWNYLQKLHQEKFILSACVQTFDTKASL